MKDELKIGDPWPFASSRGFTGRLLKSPAWYALVVAPQSEAKAKHKLENAGVEVMYPVQHKVRHYRGKKHEFTRPTISQIIYAKFIDAPNWDVMRDRRLITGVFSNGLRPVEIDEDTVREIMGLPLESVRLEQERIEALTPKVGERVVLDGGVFDGFFVDVERTALGRVWYSVVTGLGRVEGSTGLAGIQRLAV